MELTLEKLIKFDLLDELEKSLFRDKEHSIDFFATFREIQIADQFTRDCPSFPGSTAKIIRSEMVSAIGSTLAIEGTKLDADEIEESFRKCERQQVLQRTEQEAENSRKVYEFIRSLAKRPQAEFTYTEQMIKQIHKYFTDGLNYLGNVPGLYRREFVTQFGEPGRPGLCRTGTEVSKAMVNFVDWLNRKDEGLPGSNIIVKAIMAHYYLTEIHPFADGNGRTARALEALVLYVNGINQYCFWSLANFWSMNRGQYIRYLGEIRSTCDPWSLLIWGMKGYLQEIQRVKNKVLIKVKQLMFMDYVKWLFYNKKQQAIKINPRIINTLSVLVRQGPMVLDQFHSSPDLAVLYSNVTVVTRHRDFQKMKELGLIRIFTEDHKEFVQANFQLLELLEYSV